MSAADVASLDAYRERRIALLLRRAKSADACAVCGRRIDVRDTIAWHRASGFAAHMTCVLRKAGVNG